MNRRTSILLISLLVFAPAAFAARSTPGVCTMLSPSATDPNATAGIVHDGNGTYANGSIERLECSFSVNRGVVNFVTYQTGRKLQFNLPAVGAAVGAGSSFPAEVDLFGINYFGKFENMAVGATAQVQADLEFYVGRITYELDYSAIAVIRTGENEWLFTTDSNDLAGYPGFWPSSTAKLNVIRRKSQEFIGNYEAPIRFKVNLN